MATINVHMKNEIDTLFEKINEKLLHDTRER